MLNKREIDKILNINTKKENIFDIIGKMQVLLDELKKFPYHKGLMPFLETYYLVTKKVAEKNIEHKHYYKNYNQLEKLDLHFASLYFKPLNSYLKKREYIKPWQTYFKYCKDSNGIPFVQMLLGINVHINADLLTSLVYLDYKEKTDFLAINTVLKDTIPEVMKFLAFKEKDFFGFSGLLFKKFITTEFKDIVVKWRLNTYKNSLILNNRNIQRYRPIIYEQTENISKDIIKIFNSPYSFKDLLDEKSELHKLKVKLN